MIPTIDYQRITDLATAIEGLTEEDHFLLDGVLLDRAVESTEGICGGYARLRGTRIPIWTLVSFKSQGASHEELLRNYPTLTLKKLQFAWDYYDRHRVEIDTVIVFQHED